jgi:molybdopterin-guanine dinucleotide biosynthesis protein A
VVSRVSATGIVLAGGRSSRFGGDKLAATLDGRPLINHAIAAVAEVAVDVVVVLSPDGPEPPLPGGLRVRVRFTRDREEGRGPLEGVAAGLAASGQGFAIVVGGDQPTLVPALLHAMLAHLALGDGFDLDAVALVDDAEIRPLPCVLRVSTALPAAIEALDVGGGSLMGLLGLLRVGSLAPEQWRGLDPTGASLADVDRPGDLADAPQHRAGRGPQ